MPCNPESSTANSSKKRRIRPNNSERRERTDLSLSVERAKTDDAMAKKRQKDEARIDDAMSSSRKEADESTLAARQGVDGTSLERKGLRSGSQADERKAATDRLRIDRQHADGVLLQERRNFDALLASERSRTLDAQERLFALERKATDGSLNHERSHTDNEEQRSTLNLSDAHAAHGEAVAALATRDDFLAIVSHDLRSPIASVSMATNMIRVGPDYCHMSDRTQELLDLISRNADESLRLISDLLDLGRIESGRLSLEVENVDVNNLLRMSTSMFGNSAAQNGITIEVTASDSSCCTMGDRHRLSQVLSNLLGNALKFTPRGGRVVLTSRMEPEAVHVMVTDTGPGIAEDQRKAIFERLNQISKHDRKGLGLGLYISAMIVKEHGGRLWVESEVGQGSRFCFTLPVSGGSRED